ncbi:T9SS type A sorting domain-containing protein [uncultured Flavobacterium sp.]|uniref:T9SS type A sorting domain-containing protein n=1 Tax=uncultured Flavobacterium sp. TaxID=165435 RepID=UPI0025FE8905|nr:T9SS type A sorting domain-containing protein [uncultured Flavobacterium sp.]
MKKKLLFLSLLIMFGLKGFAQAEAYPVPDINQCNSEVFDLTVQTPITLGNQPANTYSVSYHLSWEDAEENQSPITNPQAFMITTGSIEQAIYIRVTNGANDEFDVTSFVVGHWGGPQVDELDDVMVCESYTLPPLQVGAYYTAPNGGGTMLPEGTVITVAAMIYIYESNIMCSSESSFYISVSASGQGDMDPLFACDINGSGMASFELEPVIGMLWQIYPGALNINMYASLEDAEAGTNAITDMTYMNVVPWQEMIYITIAGVEGCNWTIHLPLIVTECSGLTISGHIAYDTDGNGCNESDPGAAGILVYYNSGNYSNYAYTDTDGNYAFYNVPEGAINVYADTFYPDNVTSSPESHAITVSDVNIQNVNFCLSLPAPVSDVSVYVAPLNGAQPGLMATYAIVVQNFGNTVASGNVTLQFNDTQLDYLQSYPSMILSGNILVASYANLQPYQYKIIYVDFMVALPEVVALGDIISFTSTVALSAGTDANPADNTYILDQVAVNSWDPNDINVREGEQITLAQAGDYLHYIIRFQNKGTANAHNVRVDTTLDANLDWSTFEPMTGSHHFQADRSGNGSDVAFRFNNIQLPAEVDNEPESHGYVMYRIKPKSTIQVGESMSGQAHIFFDFNAPIHTNIITTTVMAPAGVNGIIEQGFVMHPNPASSTVTLKMAAEANSAAVTITDVLGKTVGQGTFTGTQSDIDVSMLNSGVYFVNVNADGKLAVQKLVVK